MIDLINNRIRIRILSFLICCERSEIKFRIPGIDSWEYENTEYCTKNISNCNWVTYFLLFWQYPLPLPCGETPLNNITEKCFLSKKLSKINSIHHPHLYHAHHQLLPIPSRSIICCGSTAVELHDSCSF